MAGGGAAACAVGLGLAVSLDEAQLAGGPGDLGGQRTGMRGALGGDHGQRGSDLRRVADGLRSGGGERGVAPGLV